MPTLAERLISKRTKLNLSATQVAELINVPRDSIYKWEKGTRPVGDKTNKKLESFINGLFDQFVRNGRLADGYDYEDAMRRINNPPNPNNDFYSGNPNEPLHYEIIDLRRRLEKAEDTIYSLNSTISTLNNYVKVLEQKLQSTGQSGTKAKAG